MLWGLWYFVLLVVEKATDVHRKKLALPFAILYRIFTLVCVLFGWVLFRATSVGGALEYIKSMFGANGNALVDTDAIKYLADYGILFLIAFVCCTPIFKKIKEALDKKYHIGNIVTFVYDIVLIGLVMLAMSSLIMGVNNPFIYFNF